jgi:hypothetical protein
VVHDPFDNLDGLGVHRPTSATYGPDPDDASTLHEAVNELARHFRRLHFEGDGCVEERPLLHLGGAALISPSNDEGYHPGTAGEPVGHDLHPAQPLRAQVDAVVKGLPGTVILSPSRANTMGLAAR